MSDILFNSSLQLFWKKRTLFADEQGACWNWQERFDEKIAQIHIWWRRVLGGGGELVVALHAFLLAKGIIFTVHRKCIARAVFHWSSFGPFMLSKFYHITIFEMGYGGTIIIFMKKCSLYFSVGFNIFCGFSIYCIGSTIKRNTSFPPMSYWHSVHWDCLFNFQKTRKTEKTAQLNSAIDEVSA